jgi:hypothetical protein
MMFRLLPVFGTDPRTTAEIVNGIMNGKTNNTGLVTLNTGNATTTTIVNERISRDSLIILVPVSDAAEADTAPYGSFSSDLDQLAASVGSTYVVEYTSTEYSSGVYLASNSRLYVRNYGIYNVQFSLQLANSTNDSQYADVWFRKNGTDVANSGSRFGLPARKSTGDPSHMIGSMNFFIELNAGDYIQLAGAVSNAGVSLEHFAANTGLPRPAIPSVITTVQYIAPSATSNVYVSAQTNGSATLTHFANSTANKTYGYVVIG